MNKLTPVMVRLPEDVHQWLVSQAKENIRSMNNQIIVLVRDAMRHRIEMVTPQTPTKAPVA